MLSSLARGRESRECVLVMGANRESAGPEKRAKKKRMRIHPFYCIL